MVCFPDKIPSHGYSQVTERIMSKECNEAGAFRNLFLGLCVTVSYVRENALSTVPYSTCHQLQPSIVDV